MKFRHATGVRLALTSGHITEVGPDWVELDQRFHQEALSLGCEVDKTVITSRKEVKIEGSENAPKLLDEDLIIKETLILMRGRNKKGDFTGSGMPNVVTVSSLAGIRTNKEQVYAMWRLVEQESAPAETPVTDAAEAVVSE